MKLIIPMAIIVALGMSACEVNTPAGTPGPAGAPGAAGARGAEGSDGAVGDKGSPGRAGNETIVVVPPAK